MKPLLRFPVPACLALATVLASPLHAGDAPADRNVIVDGVYRKEQMELQNQLNQQRRKLAELAGQRAQAQAASQAKRRQLEGAAKAMKDYDRYLSVHYVDRKGAYQSGRELESTDVENINKLFATYLKSTPLEGRVSAGQARGSLEWGIERLRELAKTHESPNEKNNSDFAIIEAQTKDANEEIQKLVGLARELGVELRMNDSQVADAPPAQGGGRAPASQR